MQVLLVFTCSPVRFVVGFIFDSFQAVQGSQQGLDGVGGRAQVGDGVCPVLEVETVARGVQTVDGSQAVQMVLPRLVRVEGVDTAAHTPRDVVHCANTNSLVQPETTTTEK